MAWLVAVSVEDEIGRKSTIKLHTDPDAEFAEVRLFAYELVATLDRIIDGQIIGVNISQTKQPGFEATEAAKHSRVQSRANLRFRTQNLDTVRVQIPTWDETKTRAIFESKRRRVDSWDPTVSALESLLVNGSGYGHPYSICDARGAELRSQESESYVTFRKRT